MKISREISNQRRRRGIFVEIQPKLFQAPSGAVYSGRTQTMSLLTELGMLAERKLQICRAYGASLCATEISWCCRTKNALRCLGKNMSTVIPEGIRCGFPSRFLTVRCGNL
jgi:hypothetical protein